MTATLARRPAVEQEESEDRCACGTPLRTRNRWGAPLPKASPDNLGTEHIEATLRLHPWLRGTRLAALIEALHDNEVMGI